MNPNSKTILTLVVRYEPDIVIARQRTRQIAGLLGFDAQDQTRLSTAVSEDVKKLNFITVTSRAKLKMVRQGFADHEDGISVSLIRGRNEPFGVKLLETLHLFNAIFLAHHPNYAHWGLQHKRIHCLML